MVDGSLVTGYQVNTAAVMGPVDGPDFGISAYLCFQAQGLENWCGSLLQLTFAFPCIGCADIISLFPIFSGCQLGLKQWILLQRAVTLLKMEMKRLSCCSHASPPVLFVLLCDLVGTDTILAEPVPFQASSPHRALIAVEAALHV